MTASIGRADPAPGLTAVGPHGFADPRSEQLVAEWEQRGVRFAAVSFVDLHGRTKAKVVPLPHLPGAALGSELYTGAALDGVPQDVSDPEVATVPELANGMVMPWRPDTVWLPSDLFLGPDPFEACSRQILKRVTRDTAELGFTFQVGIETEFYLLRDGPAGPVPASDADDLDKPCYDLRSLLRNLPIMTEIVDAMNGLGWEVYSFDHEDGNGQFETDFAYTDAVQMADRFTFFRLMAGELAQQRGLYATFMPKPYGDRTGSGAHLNMSLADAEGRNLFVPDAGADGYGCGLSRLGYQFVAGILRHADAISALVAPTVNSYKRLTRRSGHSGFTWAPIFACYGGNNRTNMLRIPGAGGRVECRAADAAMNPYLAEALMLAAGLEGIRADLDPGQPNQENMYLLDQAELRRRGIRELPRTLSEAVTALAADPLAAAVLGQPMLDAFVEYKDAEWNEYHSHVSDWERARYLRFF